MDLGTVNRKYWVRSSVLAFQKVTSIDFMFSRFPLLRCVIQPYQEFPSLLELLLSFLKTEQLVSIRRETLRVLGLLGALDPYKHKMNLGHIDSQV